MILCEPVWLRSSRLSSRRMPSSRAEVVALGEDRRATGVVAQDRVELVAERRVGPGLAERRLQLLARRHEGLGHEATTELAEPPGVGRLLHEAHYALDPSRHSSSIQSYGISSGPRCGTGAAARARSMNALTFNGSLRPGDFSTPDDDVDAPRSGQAHGLGDVVRVQTAGEDHPRSLGHLTEQPPVEDLAGAGRRRVDEDQVGGVLVGAPGVGRPADDALDHPADLRGHLGDVGRRLVPVQLGGTQPGPVGHVDHPRRQLVAEHADGEDLRREPAGDVVDLLHGDLARRRGEDEPDRVGTHRHGEERIVLAGDPADLDEHPPTIVRPRGGRADRASVRGAAARRSPPPDRPRSPASRRPARRGTRRRAGGGRRRRRGRRSRRRAPRRRASARPSARPGRGRPGT